PVGPAALVPRVPLAPRPAALQAGPRRARGPRAGAIGTPCAARHRRRGVRRRGGVGVREVGEGSGAAGARLAGSGPRGTAPESAEPREVTARLTPGRWPGVHS